MRVTSEFFVSALVRRIFAEGGFAALSRKGAAEAGAIFITVDRLDGSFDFYGPAPQALFGERAGERLFEQLILEGAQTDIDMRIKQEERMDPDFWHINIEARGGAIDLPIGADKKEAPGSEFFKF